MMIRILYIPHMTRKLIEVVYEEANKINNMIRSVFQNILISLYNNFLAIILTK